MDSLSITHTYETGSIVAGTSRGDGSNRVLKLNRWRFSRTLDAWYLPGSRGRTAPEQLLTITATQLRAHGFEVDVDIDTAVPDARARESFTEQRQAEREDRLRRRVDETRSAAEAAADREQDTTAALPPFGEPIKVGHHSQHRHERALQRAHVAAAAIQADHTAARAQRDLEAHLARQPLRYSPVSVTRQVAKLERDLRQVQRKLDGSTHTFAGGYRETTPPATGDRATRLTRERDRLRDDLAHWQKIHAHQVATGEAQSYSSATINVGDLIQHRTRWHLVTRVNPKSVTVTTDLGKHTIRYADIAAHRPAPSSTRGDSTGNSTVVPTAAVDGEGTGTPHDSPTTD